MDSFISVITQLNTSKVFAGISMLLLNVGSRFIVADIKPSQEKLLSNTVAKRLVLFSMLFVATRDVITAACMTTALVILAESLLNEKSRYCLLPKHFVSPPGPPSLTEYQKARHVVKSFESQNMSLNVQQPPILRPATPVLAYMRASKALAHILDNTSR